MDNIEENMESLKSIRSLGVEIAIDDFGTGYSSLGYLARLPATALKIDRAFIASMLDDPNAMTLVQTVISLAHSLRLKVIAEGVEIEEQAKVLRLLRCDEIQGWLIGYPLSFEEMTRLLQREEPDGANSEFRSK
jgi:EAL domain-containing protein (putative c-di-GMP-specific phosphodiesterase class I)